MVQKKLHKALSSVDWNANVSEFLKDNAACETIANCNLRLALWSKQFEVADAGNPALSFTREMQVAANHVSALISLALYKPAASAMRTILETALYYTYFRTHHTELATLVRETKFFLWKSKLLEYHMTHTPSFNDFQNQFGLIGNLDSWYKHVSCIVHGQIPGGWLEHKSLRNTKHVKKTLGIVVDSFSKGEQIVHQLFLCTVAQELWHDFESSAKKLLTKGIPRKTRFALRIDTA